MMDLTWECEKCTLINEIEHSKCAICGNPRGWLCSSCHHRNAADARDCELCRHRNQAAAPGHSNEASGSSGSGLEVEELLACPKCTLLNPKSAHICAACDYKLQNATVSGALRRPPLRTRSNSQPTIADDDQSRNFSPRAGTSFSIDADAHAQMQVLAEDKAKALYLEVVDFCTQSKQVFVDDSFPPTQKSLGSLDNKVKARVTQWHRPGNIKPRNVRDWGHWSVYRDPLPSDISQALAVITERRELIEKIVLTPQVSLVGVYQIRVCVDGEWKVVIVDDLFPVDEWGRLIFSEGRRLQLWVPLIEKACAKLRGSYASLVAGRTVEGLATLTGMPCEELHLHARTHESESHDPDLIWAKLLTAKEAGFLMGASCGMEEIPAEEFTRVGLEPNHAYSVLHVWDMDGHRLLQLRNPWGRFTWKGDWSDGWPGWTPDLRKVLLPHGGHEGIFWISFPDFSKFFYSVDICKARLDWHESRISSPLPSHTADQKWYLYRVTVTEPTEVGLTLYQNNSRTDGFAGLGLLDLTSDPRTLQGDGHRTYGGGSNAVPK